MRIESARLNLVTIPMDQMQPDQVAIYLKGTYPSDVNGIILFCYGHGTIVVGRIDNAGYPPNACYTFPNSLPVRLVQHKLKIVEVPTLPCADSHKVPCLPEGAMHVRLRMRDLKDGETAVIDDLDWAPRGVIVQKTYNRIVGIGHVDGLAYDKNWFWAASSPIECFRVECVLKIQE